MINLFDIFEKLYHSEYNYQIFFLLAALILFLVITSVYIVKEIKIRESISKAKTSILIGYKRMDDKAKMKLIERLQLASNESDVKIRLSIIENLDLHLIERSNIRNYVPFLNIYILIILLTILFVSILNPIYTLFNSWKTTIVVSIFISAIPIILLDTLTVFNASKTRKTTANFLSLLLSWLEIRNDILYAFEHVYKDVEAPLSFYLKDAITQLKSGVEPNDVFDILSYKINTSQFYTITKNFKSVFNNGGDVVSLVKELEKEAYMVDNEFETRITDTFVTRLLLNILLLAASFFLIGVLLLNPTLNQIYTNTPGGQNIMFISTVIFISGILWNLKSSTNKE